MADFQDRCNSHSANPPSADARSSYAATAYKVTTSAGPRESQDVARRRGPSRPCTTSSATTPRVMGVPGPRPGPTTSGLATLVALSKADARALTPDDVLLTPWVGGYLALAVDGVRDSAWGEGAQHPCVVVDVHAAASSAPASVGVRLTFALEDLLRVAEARS